MGKSFLSDVTCSVYRISTALSPSDKIALATLFLSIPGIIVTIWGAIINYQNFKQLQALCKEKLPTNDPICQQEQELTPHSP
jgi:hypothetical protein